MAKRTSENKKRKYAAQSAITLKNKKRKILKHIKRQPKDMQSAKVAERLL